LSQDAPVAVEKAHLLTIRAEIAARLKDEIGQSPLSQNALAQALGITSGAVSSWMSGRTQPSLEQLAVICRGLNLSADRILGLGKRPRRSEPHEDALRHQFQKSALASAKLKEFNNRRRIDAAKADLARAGGELAGVVSAMTAQVLRIAERETDARERALAEQGDEDDA